MYIVGVELITKDIQSQLSEMYSNNLSKLNLDYCLVAIDSNWINLLNEQLSKFIIINLLKSIRLKYSYMYPDFIIFFNNIRSKYN